MRTGILRVVLLFHSVLLFPFFAHGQKRDPTLSVHADEPSARLELKEKSSLFSLELSADAAKPVAATLTARILAPDDKPLAEASIPVQLGSTPRRAQLPLQWAPESGLQGVANARLIYEVRLEGDSTPAASGILSPYALIPDLFELHFLGLDAIGIGHTYLARVWATRPDSDKPLAGVSLTALIGDDVETDTPKAMKAKARTDSRGEALLTFRLPEATGAPEDQEADLEIRGTRGNFQNSLTATLRFWRRAAILLSTDKPLYQPEQALHMRVLVLDDQRRAWAKQPVRFTVHDPDDTAVFSADAQTSRFGIASADWSIPSSQKLGNYRVSADIAGDADSRELQGNQLIRISRYELPTFTVNVVPDKPFYLAGQNAEVTVSGSYLFGKPVLRGHARVVRETSRQWNYREQKWETEEGPVLEGELDARNEFHATLDLSKDHADLGDKDWRRFEDLRYAAYVTDASSKRTQERHFDVRVSRDAVHLYVLNAAGELPVGLHPVFYISSSLADGTPAAADVRVKLYAEDSSEAGSSKPPTHAIAEAQVRTNRYGIARVRLPEPLRVEKTSDNKSVDRIYVALEAKTAGGRTGRHLESYSLQEEPALRITPVKAIFKPGEPIEAEVESSVPEVRIGVEVIRADTRAILASQELKPSRGSARITFPADEQFTGVLSLAAYPLKIEIEPYSMYSRVASASVIVPKPSNLQLDVKPVKATYRPGDAATVSLHVRGPHGAPAESAMGLLVYDQAVEELARTEASLFTGGYERLDPRLGFHSLEEDSESVAGVSLNQLLNREPQASVPADLELAAEALLFNRGGATLRTESSDSPRYLNQVFQKKIRAALDPVAHFFQEHFTNTGHFPGSDAEYAGLLKKKGIDASELRDPWGRPYHVRRTYEFANEVLEFRSEGPDKTPNTSDDFTAMSLSRPFFEKDAQRLRRAIDSYHARTGGYIRDKAMLESACAYEHISFADFTDPWGTPYRFLFDIEQDNYIIKVVSAGPEKRFRGDPNDPARDWYDQVVSLQKMPYFQETAQRISEALFESAKASAHFPETAEEFRKVMKDHGMDWDAVRDPWGRPYRIVPAVEAGYSDKITVRAYGDNVSAAQKPVTRSLKTIKIMSDGPDGTPSGDDFALARFASPFLEESGGAAGKTAPPQKPQPLFSGNSGAVRVLVKDPVGAVIPNAKIRLTNEATGVAYEGTANDEGLCLVSNLPAGSYRLLVEKPGFRSYVLTNVPVLSSNATDVEVTLNVGAIMETVEVSASSMRLQTTTTELAVSQGLVLTTKSGAASGQIKMPLATPRLREYFPETLLWQPEIHTNRAGHTTVKVPLADSITTWKVSVIASTLDGSIATVSTDIRAFLPFFAELDPPKVLTVGDELHLPVTVRNYLDKRQEVSLEWSAEPWSELLSPRAAHIKVPAGDYADQTFSFRAARPMKDAKQRLTAFNRSSANDSDAIEKKLRIHADGQQRFVQASSVFSGDTSLSLEIPGTALPGSVEAELIVYPNLIAHVSDAIEGIMERPYGCAEQTISSAYPSLLWLQLQKSRQLPPAPLDARALHYLHLAYARLLRYREPGGGFSLWGHGWPQLPVSAYALRFLTEASEFIEVDPDIIAGVRAWLLQQAAPQGGWMEKDSNGKSLEGSVSYLTAYLVEALARDLQRRAPSDKNTEKDIEIERQAVRNGIAYFSQHVWDRSDPYDIALVALAKLSAHDDASAEIGRLLSLDHGEGETSYWDLQHNTIFYGWGFTGRIETTALVLDALAIAKQQRQFSADLDRALNRGTLFLLKNKDQYGVWYSTQATVDVLQTLIRQLDSGSPQASRQPMRIFVDGKPGPLLPASSDARQLTPLRADLTGFLAPGKHTVELRDGGSAHSSAYVNAGYYLPWTDPAVAGSLVPSGDAESFRYSVKIDHPAASIGDAIQCTVHAERVGFHGYGMMLSEVGLPPGADVDRASLDSAVSASGWDLQSYEVQPDRVVFYLWPRPGGTTFSFTFKPRFAMTAQSSESILYDYYNPEARASVPPTRFVVK